MRELAVWVMRDGFPHGLIVFNVADLVLFAGPHSAVQFAQLDVTTGSSPPRAPPGIGHHKHWPVASALRAGSDRQRHKNRVPLSGCSCGPAIDPQQSVTLSPLLRAKPAVVDGSPSPCLAPLMAWQARPGPLLQRGPPDSFIRPWHRDRPVRHRRICGLGSWKSGEDGPGFAFSWSFS